MKYMNGDDGPYKEAFAKAEKQISKSFLQIVKSFIKLNDY